MSKRKFYLREYYETNRRVWPEMSHISAFIDAFKLAVKVWWRV